MHLFVDRALLPSPTTMTSQSYARKFATIKFLVYQICLPPFLINLNKPKLPTRYEQAVRLYDTSYPKRLGHFLAGQHKMEAIRSTNCTALQPRRYRCEDVKRGNSTQIAYYSTDVPIQTKQNAVRCVLCLFLRSFDLYWRLNCTDITERMVVVTTVNIV
jgi:hypothetical protein